jgi:hypothetical protein
MDRLSSLRHNRGDNFLCGLLFAGAQVLEPELELADALRKEDQMTISSGMEQPLAARFIEGGAKVLLELTNLTDHAVTNVEILSIFLSDEETLGGPSRAHIKFEAVKSIQPKEKAVLNHRTWIDGKPVNPDHDQLQRLKVLVGETKPYVLDISWENAEGRTRFQRIPVGH